MTLTVLNYFFFIIFLHTLTFLFFFFCPSFLLLPRCYFLCWRYTVSTSNGDDGAVIPDVDAL